MSDREDSPAPPPTLAVPPGVVVPPLHRSLVAAGITFGPYGASQDYALTMSEAELEHVDLYDFVDAYRMARKEKAPLMWAEGRECSVCQHHGVTCVIEESKKLEGDAQLPCNRCRTNKTPCPLSLEYTALILAEYMGFPVEWTEARIRKNWQAVKRTGSVSYNEIQTRIRARVRKAKAGKVTDSGDTSGHQEQITGSVQDIPSVPREEGQAETRQPSPNVERTPSPPLNADAISRPPTPIFVNQAPTPPSNADPVSRLTTPVAEPSTFSNPPPSPENLVPDVPSVNSASPNPNPPAPLSTLERNYQTLEEKHRWALRKIQKLKRQNSELEGKKYKRCSTSVQQEIRILHEEVDLQAKYTQDILRENNTLRQDVQRWKGYVQMLEDDVTAALEHAEVVEEEVDERVRIERERAVTEVRTVADREIERYRALHIKLKHPVHTLHWLKTAVEQIQLGDQLEILTGEVQDARAFVRRMLDRQLKSIGPVARVKKQDVGSHLKTLMRTAEQASAFLDTSPNWKERLKEIRWYRWTNKYQETESVVGGVRTAGAILDHFGHSTEFHKYGHEVGQGGFWGENKAIQADDPDRPPTPRQYPIWHCTGANPPVKGPRSTEDDCSGNDCSGDNRSGDDHSGDHCSGDDHSGDHCSGNDQSEDDRSGDDRLGDDDRLGYDDVATAEDHGSVHGDMQMDEGGLDVVEEHSSVLGDMQVDEGDRSGSLNVKEDHGSVLGDMQVDEGDRSGSLDAEENHGSVHGVMQVDGTVHSESLDVVDGPMDVLEDVIASMLNESAAKSWEDEEVEKYLCLS